MPYYIGDVIKDANKLTARTPEKFREGGIEVMQNNRVERVDTDAQEVLLEDGAKIPYDILALGTGTTAMRAGIPGEDMDGVFVLKHLGDALNIKRYLKDNKCQKAIVVGAGFIGMEVCEAFATLGMETSVVHRGQYPANRWDPELSGFILEEIRKNQVTFHTNMQIIAIEKGPQHPLRLHTNQGPLDGDLILLALGVKPDVALAKGMGLAIGQSGAVAVNYSQQTSIPNIYAAGDCCEAYHRVSRRWVNIPLGDIANKQGRVAGSVIGGKPMIFPGIVGAQSFRIFHLEAAATGINEKEALGVGYCPVSDITWGNATAASMPGPKKLGLKLIADRVTGRLLGAQAVGEKGAVGRINTLSAALWTGMRLDEIGYLDLAYAPPFSGSWDIIHIAAQKLLRKM